MARRDLLADNSSRWHLGHKNPWRCWTGIAADPRKVVAWKCITCGNEGHEPTSPACGTSPAAAKQPHLEQSKKSKVFRKEEHALDMALSCALFIFSKECLRSCNNWEVHQVLAVLQKVTAAGSPPFRAITGTQLVTEAHCAKPCWNG